ncbi:MAG: hypothetical protein LUD27_05945 [Clostridia bacterium]|nr:hypothetical protein [Clostridia bacterium]
MKENNFSYKKTYGGIEFTVIVRQGENARETVAKKLEHVLLKDLSDEVRSKGEAV